MLYIQNWMERVFGIRVKGVQGLGCVFCQKNFIFVSRVFFMTMFLYVCIMKIHIGELVSFFYLFLVHFFTHQIFIVNKNLSCDV